jgi:ubiquinone/menaquinone biosynthesis C-methylase UbiE
MAFDVAAEDYDRYMGRYSAPLADELLRAAPVSPGDRALDVGCGPGALTVRLAERLGESSVAGVDPSQPFVEAARSRLSGSDIRLGAAEQLPFEDAAFDAVFAHLVVPFMADADAGVAEMRRVGRPGARVAVTAWDHAGGGPLAAFWHAAREVDPGAPDESGHRGAREGDLPEVLRESGLEIIEPLVLLVEVQHADFDEWWAPYTYGVGPAGDYMRGLSPEHRTAIERRAREDLGAGPISIIGKAWCALGRVPGRS